MAQCGNYNPQTRTGFILGSTPRANAIRHESGTVQSHYINYVVAQASSTNNLGVNAEFQVGVPSQTLAGFNTAVTNLLNQKIGAMGVEPCGTHGMEYGATCYF